MSATGANAPKLTYAQYKAAKTRRTVTHPIVTDDDAVLAFKVADDAVRRAKQRGDLDAVPALEQALADAETAVRESTILFRLRALPRGDYAALKADHPPTDVDDARAAELSGDPKAKAKWHVDSFGPALVSACLLEPAVTLEQATEMAADMNDAEWSSLLFAAIQVNETATDTAGLVFS